MIKKIIVFITILCFQMSPFYVSAAEEVHPTHVKASEAFIKKKNIAEKKMKYIENLVGKIAKEKRVAKGDAEQLDKLIDESVKAVNDAVMQSIEDAKMVQKSDGKEGSTKSFVEFEKMAQNHEKRAKAVDEKVKEIEKQIKNGDVELEEPLLKSMTKEERKEYMEFMTSGGQEKMKKKYPDLLSGISVETKSKLSKQGNVGNYAAELCWSASEKLGDLLVPPAEAAIGVAAGATCGATGGLACAAAIVLLVFLFAQATDNLNKCLAGQCACKWWKPWCCSGRTGCWVAYYVECA